MREEQHVGRHVNCTLRPSSLTNIKTLVPHHIKLPTASRTVAISSAVLVLLHAYSRPNAPPLRTAATRPVPTGQRADIQAQGVEEKMAIDVFKRAGSTRKNF